MRANCWPGRGLTKAGLALAMLLAPAAARAQLSVEYFQGTAFNLPTPLTIRQDTFPPISFTADYSVRPLEDIFYYVLRVGYWKDNDGWLVELLHHKIYLENPPAEVDSFEVSHGYNIITLNRAWRRGQTLVMAGGGAVVGHSNSTIRGRHRPITAPYTLAGAAIQGGAARRLDLTPWLFASVEGKVTAAWARVPIADGTATAPNIALHVVVGVGAQF